MKNVLSLFLIIIFGCQQEARVTEPTAPDPVDIQRRIALCAPVLDDTTWYSSDSKAPLLEGLDVLNFPITTNSKEAQAYFNQGLTLSYGFNHAEAARSFYYASKLDPTCAMAHWGYAYVLGPNYNAGMSAENYVRAYEAIQKARTLITDQTTAKEKDLIEALAKRYVKEPVEDRYPLDVAYSNAMEAVFEQYPDDADIGTLYAESLMDLHPWDIWDKEGNPREWTPEILAVFDRVFETDPRHPGAHHLYIHAVEASTTPQLGLRSANLYDEDLVPGAGHLVHMPSHIYIRTGDYHKGTLSNLRAVQVDSTYLSNCYAQGTYPFTLYPHNYHFMAATATMEGNSELAIHAAQKVADHANRQLMKEPGWGTIQHYYTIPYFVKVKFGRWQQILDMEVEDQSIPYPLAIQHYARGMAYLGLNDLQNSKTELQKLSAYAQDEAFKDVLLWDVNSTYDLLQIASHVLKARILSHEGEYDQAVALLKEAVDIEDALNYQEPPDWFFSVRHELGDVLTRAGRYDEAVTAYEEDLRRLPKNGWALHGLSKAYAMNGDPDREKSITQQLETAWAYADVELDGSVVK